MDVRSTHGSMGLLASICSIVAAKFVAVTRSRSAHIRPGQKSHPLLPKRHPPALPCLDMLLHVYLYDAPCVEGDAHTSIGKQRG